MKKMKIFKKQKNNQKNFIRIIKTVDLKIYKKKITRQTT